MSFRLDEGPSTDSLPQAWVTTGHRRDRAVVERLSAVEAMISYWVPVSQEREVRLGAIERRLARLEEEAIPPDYPCVAELAARVDTLEATVWELARRLNNLSSAGGEAA